MGLHSHPEALQEPPGGPVMRRPILVAAIGLLVVVAILLLGDVFRDRSASFMSWQRGAPCPAPETKGTRCFEVEVMNVGPSPGRARCTWGSGGFTTAVLDENASETRIIVADVTRGMDVDCRDA